MTRNLLALGSAAVLAVYSAGYARTRDAARKLEEASERRRPTPAAFVNPAVRPLTLDARGVAAAPQAAKPKVSAPRTARTIPSAAVDSSRQTQTDAADSARTKPADTASHTEPAPAPAPATAAVPPVAKDTAVVEPKKVVLKDGTYTGWGTSRHGDIQATVTIEKGRITYAAISECQTRYPCSYIGMLPPQVVARQSPDVDYVSGATQSTNAFYYAVLEALGKAK